MQYEVTPHMSYVVGFMKRTKSDSFYHKIILCSIIYNFVCILTSWPLKCVLMNQNVLNIIWPSSIHKYQPCHSASNVNMIFTTKLKKFGHEKCQGTCSYKHTPKFVSLDNKVTVYLSFGDYCRTTEKWCQLFNTRWRHFSVAPH